MNKIIDDLFLSGDKEILLKVVYTLITLAISWILKFFISHIIHKKVSEQNARFTVRKIVHYLVTLISLIVIGSIWIVNFSKIGTVFGLFTAGIAISLKDIFLNIAGWLFIFIRRPFSIGDRIEINGSAGDVIDIKLFQFSILEIRNWVDADQSTGRIIDIPNGFVFTNQQINFNKNFDYIWNEIKILVTFESDWEKAKKILLDIIEVESDTLNKEAKMELTKATKKNLIMYANIKPIIYTSIKDSGVLLTIRYLCRPKKRRNSEHTIYEKILREFAKHKDIDFAYPTTRLYNHKIENIDF